MKSKFSRIVVLGLVLVLAIALAVPTAVVAKELKWGKDTADTPFVKESFASGKCIQPATDILNISAANDGKTIYAVVRAEAVHPDPENKDRLAQEVWRSTNAGETWASRSPTSGNTSRVAFVAVSPDDPEVVVAAGIDPTSGNPYVWLSLEKGESGTWSGSDISGQLDGDITSLAISEERDDTRWVAVGSSVTAIPFTFYTAGAGTAEWSTEQAKSATHSVKLTIPAGGVAWANNTNVWVYYGGALSTITNANFEYSYWQEAYGALYGGLYIDTTGDGLIDHVLSSQRAATNLELNEWTTTAQVDLWAEVACDSAGVPAGTQTGWQTLAKWQSVYPTATLVFVAAAWGYYGGEARVIYIDDITINSTTYDLEQDPEQAKCLAVAKAEAFAGWSNAAAWTGFSGANAAADGVLAVAFSPWFNNDNTLLAVTVSPSGTYLQAAEVDTAFANCEFNASTTPFTAYPVEIGTDVAATAASISLPDTYYGLDAAERIAYIGTTDGVYRLDDDLSEKIKSGSLPRVAYNSEENQLLVGYSTSGRVDMSANPDSGSPTFTRPASMKSPSGESVSGVAWVDSTMMCSTTDDSTPIADDESAISVSTDARAWSQISLIDTDLSNITDIAVAADGSKIYLGSQSSDGDYYSVWRYTSSWERVLCDKKATSPDQTSVIVRLAPEKPEVVFVALKGTKEIRRSTDSGETWKQSRSDIAIIDMVAKDDKIVLTVTSGGYVSTSTDGARTFADYVKSSLGDDEWGNVHMIVAPNGDILIGGCDQTSYEATAAYSTDDGDSWTKAAEDSDITASPYQIIIAADKDYATNNTVYIAQGDEIVRWPFGGDKDKWEDIEVSGCPITADDIVSGLAYGGETLYALYYNTTDNTSGFGNTLNPTSKTVYWGGEEVSDVYFSLVPQALQASTASSSTLWAVDTRDTINAVWTYTDPIGAVGAPVPTAPDDGYKASVDVALQKVNPVRFAWEEVHKDCSYELKIATNSAMSQHVETYSLTSTGKAITGESLTVTDGSGGAASLQYAFAAGETYYWRMRVLSPVRGPYSETRSFTIEEAVAAVAPAPVVTVTPPEVTVEAPPPAPAPQVTVEAPAPAAVPAPAIPAYLLWTIIGIGAVLIIALIILIVRTRRVV